MYKITQCNQKSFIGKEIAIENGCVHIEEGFYRVAKIMVVGQNTIIDATNIIFHTEEI